MIRLIKSIIKSLKRGYFYNFMAIKIRNVISFNKGTEGEIK